MPGFGNWHPAVDHLAGIEVYGDPNNEYESWSTKFDDLLFEEMLISFGDRS